ncbi:MAG: hypothetical protein ABI203_01275 [Mucilaginibacter sp.]
MNPTVELIFTIVGGALVLLTIYGAVTLHRKLFLSGICFFSILPLIGESMAYNTDKGSVHIVVIFVFLIQAVLALPSNITYTSDNVAAGKLTSKIALSMLLINVGGIVYVFFLKAAVPAQFGYYHVGIALAILYVMMKRMSGPWAWAK